MKKKKVISRSEQAPGSGFHRCDKKKVNCEFLGGPLCNEMVDVSFGSYELLMSDIVCQMNEK